MIGVLVCYVVEMLAVLTALDLSGSSGYRICPCRLCWAQCTRGLNRLVLHMSEVRYGCSCSSCPRTRLHSPIAHRNTARASTALSPTLRLHKSHPSESCGLYCLSTGSVGEVAGNRGFIGMCAREWSRTEPALSKQSLPRCDLLCLSIGVLGTCANNYSIPSGTRLALGLIMLCSSTTPRYQAVDASKASICESSSVLSSVQKVRQSLVFEAGGMSLNQSNGEEDYAKFHSHVVWPRVVQNPSPGRTRERPQQSAIHA